MSAAVEVKLNEIDRLKRKLEQFTLSGGDKERLLTSLGKVIETQTRERVRITKEGPSGDPWHDLTEAYKRRKAKGPDGGILVQEGNLLDEIAYQLTDRDSVLIGSAAEYADFHQNAKNKKRHREFLGLSTENIEELEDSIDVFMRKKIA
jgi:phage virion morphogenesis protein